MTPGLRYRTLSVLPHFLWSKPRTGFGDSLAPHQYAVRKISTTESDEEPIMCGIEQQQHRQRLAPGWLTIHNKDEHGRESRPSINATVLKSAFTMEVAQYRSAKHGA